MTRYEYLQNTVRSYYTLKEYKIDLRPNRMRPRPVLYETEAATKANYCETKTDTYTEKVVSRHPWVHYYFNNFSDISTE